MVSLLEQIQDSQLHLLDYPKRGQIHNCTSQGLLSSLHSADTLPEVRPPNLPNEPKGDKPLKLLLPSLTLDILDLLGFEGLISTSTSSLALILATTSWVMLVRQKGQTGTVGQDKDEGSGFLWQQRARVQCAHIWWPHGPTSIVHNWSKHMQHRSTSLTCLTFHWWMRKVHALPKKFSSSIFHLKTVD